MNDNIASPKASAEQPLDVLEKALGQIAQSRAEIRHCGYEMPDDIRESVLRIRKLLRDAGLPESEIDVTPGLELW